MNVFQYPGVAQSIDSDVNNIMTVLKLSNMLPEGTVISTYIYIYSYILCIYSFYNDLMFRRSVSGAHDRGDEQGARSGV